MLQYVHAQEHHPDCREQLISCYSAMWTVDRTKEFFHRGIVTNTGSFKKRAIFLEFMVVSTKIKAFPNIHWIFQFHNLKLMKSAPYDCFNYLTRKFYTLYASTLINLVVTNDSTK